MSKNPHLHTRVLQCYAHTIFFLALSLTIVGCASSPRKPVPTKADIPGVWVGLSEDLNYTCFLELQPDNTGIFALKFMEKEAVIYKVESWGLRGRDILVRLKPIRASAGSFNLGLMIHWYNALDAHISGIHQGSHWQINARLLRESFMNGRIRTLETEVKKNVSG